MRCCHLTQTVPLGVSERHGRGREVLLEPRDGRRAGLMERKKPRRRQVRQYSEPLLSLLSRLLPLALSPLLVAASFARKYSCCAPDPASSVDLGSRHSLLRFRSFACCSSTVCGWLARWLSGRKRECVLTTNMHFRAYSPRVQPADGTPPCSRSLSPSLATHCTWVGGSTGAGARRSRGSSGASGCRP